MTVIGTVVVAATLLILGVVMIVVAYRRRGWVDRVIRQILDEHDKERACDP